MDILEVLFAVALWLLFAFLGWRKRAARKGEAAPPPAPPGKGAGRGLLDELRDLARQFREGWVPPEERAKTVSRGEEAAASLIPPPPGATDRPPPDAAPTLGPPTAHRRRRSALTRDLLRDLSSGRKSLARAMLLCEVLGPPVALRSGDGRDPTAHSR